MEGNKKTAREIIDSYDGRPLRIMEVCGTHTHEIFRLGIRSILPPAVKLISGPGCPVCVTPVDYIDEAVMLALEHGAKICTFGDLIRVPGSARSLADARAQGADLRVVYSPADAVKIAAADPDTQVVFLSVGFETTTPGACLAVKQAEEQGLSNFSLLTANKTMPNAYRALKDSVDAYLYPGHVHAIIGTKLCEQMAAGESCGGRACPESEADKIPGTRRSEGVSGVVAGFTAKELLTAIAVIIEKSKTGEPFFVNCYPRVVKPEGNPAALRMIEEVMEPCDAEWRGLGVIPDSGLKLRDEYAAFDARKKFSLPKIEGRYNPACRCGDVLRGECRPCDCGAFGRGCTPEHPIGACMVSGEGACSAWYQYGI